MFKIQSPRAFTLIELLVVISIIGMLSSVVLASLGSAREKAILSKGITFETHLSRAWGDNLVAQFNFDDEVACYTDTSGNGNTVWNVSPPYNIPSFPNGIKGLAVYRGSPSANCTVDSFFASRPSFNSSNGSLSLYIKPETLSSDRIIIWIKDMQLTLKADSKLAIGYNGSHVLTSNKTVDNNKWTHVLVSWGNDNGTNNTKIYLNGVLDSTLNNLPIFTSDELNINVRYLSLDNISIYSKSIQSP